MDVTEWLKQAALDRETMRARSDASSTAATLGEAASTWKPTKAHLFGLARIEVELAKLNEQVAAMRNLYDRVQDGTWEPRPEDL